MNNSEVATRNDRGSKKFLVTTGYIKAVILSDCEMTLSGETMGATRVQSSILQNFTINFTKPLH